MNALATPALRLTLTETSSPESNPRSAVVVAVDDDDGKLFYTFTVRTVRTLHNHRDTRITTDAFDDGGLDYALSVDFARDLNIVSRFAECAQTYGMDWAVGNFSFSKGSYKVPNPAQWDRIKKAREV